MTRSKAWLAGAAAVLLLGFAALASLSLGIVSLPPETTLQALFDPAGSDRRASAVIWSIRLPRIVVAMLVGAALATVGAVMQAILRNPLAAPGITGVSAGAAVGAVLGITTGLTASH